MTTPITPADLDPRGLLAGRGAECAALLRAGRLLHDTAEGGAQAVGLGGNTVGVECFRTTTDGVRVAVLVTFDGTLYTIAACPLPPVGCGPEVARLLEDGHDHTEDDVIHYAVPDADDGDLRATVALVLDDVASMGWIATVADLPDDLAPLAAAYAASVGR